MTNIILNGCNGRMGKMITELAQNYDDLKIVAGVDLYKTGNEPFPCYANISEVKEEADVIIDFSNVKAVDEVMAYAEEKKEGLVLCTTGLSDEQIEKVKSLSEKVPVLRSGNMSLGINTVMKVLNEISPKLLSAGFDADIVEKHHNKKLDAPSGTALMLADSINEAVSDDYEYVFSRHERRMERPSKEIGISAVRGGTIVGEHEVIFAGPDEIIEIKHTALSRGVFANGALNAALFIDGKNPGLYTMSDVVK